jgi:hypothetical protein
LGALRWLRLAIAPVFFGLLLLPALACTPPKKPPKPDPVIEEPKESKEPAPASRSEGWVAPSGPVHPAPFTGEQIRDATKPGRTYRYRVEEPGKSPREHTIKFAKVDEAGAEISTDGGPTRRMGWTMLQKHAEFPKDRVTTREVIKKTPAGKFECVVYMVKGDDGEVSHYYFAKELPGAPIVYYTEKDGKRIRTTTLVEHDPGK